MKRFSFFRRDTQIYSIVIEAETMDDARDEFDRGFKDLDPISNKEEQDVQVLTAPVVA
jgi:hypothetical protein